jgi:hypothetical protein
LRNTLDVNASGRIARIGINKKMTIAIPKVI